jgi:hypothetical protein
MMKADSAGVRKWKDELACSGKSMIRREPRKPKTHVMRPSILRGG